jgi:uncharacterized protein
MNMVNSGENNTRHFFCFTSISPEQSPADIAGRNTGRDDLRQHILQGVSETAIHNIIMDLLKTYMWVGGMPAVVDAWFRFKDANQCQSLQNRIITAYQQDFTKYAKRNQIANIEKVFSSIPQQLSNKFKFSQVDHEVRSTSLKNALNLLVKAGIVYQCFHTSGQALPLKANKNEKHFKVFFFDIGLAQCMLNLDLKEWVTKPIDVRHLGAISEQLVAQEYIAYSSLIKPAELYYWHREARQSNAEVDFLFVNNSSIIPAEVKAGTKGGMKSLTAFLNSHPSSEYGLKISQSIARTNDNLKEISLYGLSGWMNGHK